MGWTAPAHWTETESQLKKTGSVTLDANGNGTIIFDPDNARQRWIVEQVAVKTNQSSTATLVPIAQIALNTVDVTILSAGLYFGASWSGNQDTFRGSIDVGPCDFLTIAFSPPPMQSGASLSGVIAYATVTGSKYTRRA